MDKSQVYRDLIAEARKEGRIEASREVLLMLVRAKYKGRHKEEDIEMINTQDSVEILNAWFSTAVKSEKYSDFRKALRR